jgi:hypothetical protein
MSRGREAGVLLSRRGGRIGWTLLLGALLLVGCGKTRQPIEPSSLLAYNDAAIAARLGQRLGIQSSTSVGQEILLTRTDGRVLKVRPTTVVYVEDTKGMVHQFYPPFEVSLEGETLTITMDGTDPVSFSRAELAELFVQL